MVEPETDAARFWAFALRVYLPEAAQARFLRFQEAGGDVPLALFCLWCGAGGVRLSGRTLRAAIAFSTEWREARVAPLRALRRGWKDAPGPLPPALSEKARQQVARAEQAVERLQMEHLATLTSAEDRRDAAAAAGTDAARANLDLYCRLASVSPEEEDLAAMVAGSA